MINTIRSLGNGFSVDFSDLLDTIGELGLTEREKARKQSSTNSQKIRKEKDGNTTRYFRDGYLDRITYAQSSKEEEKSPEYFVEGRYVSKAEYDAHWKEVEDNKRFEISYNGKRYDVNGLQVAAINKVLESATLL